MLAILHACQNRPMQTAKRVLIATGIAAGLPQPCRRRRAAARHGHT